MTDQVDGALLSNKLKEFLCRQLEESMHNIIKKKRKRTILKTLFHITTFISIIISTVLAATATAMVIPPIVIIILSIASGVLTGVSSRFNFQNANNKLTKEIDKYTKLKNKLDYIITCNGDLTADIYKQILSEFTAN